MGASSVLKLSSTGALSEADESLLSLLLHALSAKSTHRLKTILVMGYPYLKRQLYLIVVCFRDEKSVQIQGRDNGFKLLGMGISVIDVCMRFDPVCCSNSADHSLSIEMVAERKRVDRLDIQKPARTKASPSRSTAKGDEKVFAQV